jgi:trk system potassium uptake protein TrkH
MALSPRMFRALAWCAVMVALAALPFVAFALLEGAQDAARGFFFTAIAGGFSGGVILAGTRGADSPAGAPAALRLALYGWLLVPLLAAAPLVIVNGSLSAGVFEAYSALTTTGAVILPPEAAPRSIILWRSLAAWMGGLASLVLAATIFAALDRRGVGLRRTSLLTVERSDLFTNFGRALRRLGAIYAAMTGLGALGLALTGAPLFEAICLSLAALSTSGLAPFSGGLLQQLNIAGMLLMVILCLAGAWNFAVMYDLVTRRRMGRGTGEMRAIIAAACIVALAAVALLGLPVLLPAFFDALFAITTSGYQSTSQSIAGPAVWLLLALVGGSTISTSGGIKMPRILLLVRRSAGELDVLAHPSATVRTQFSGRPVSDTALAGGWGYALAFPFALALGAVLIGMGGADFDAAWRMSAAALTNAGPLAAVDWSQQSPASLYAACVMMVLGRLEVLAAAAAIYVIFARD